MKQALDLSGQDPDDGKPIDDASFFNHPVKPLSRKRSAEPFRSPLCSFLQSENGLLAIKSMSTTIGDTIASLVMGAFSGAVAGAIVKRKNKATGLGRISGSVWSEPSQAE